MDFDFIHELFSQFRPVTIKRMFGGAGLYCAGLMFGLVFDEAIYLKVEESGIPDFEREGSQPFVYSRAKSPVRSRSYWRLPERLYDDPDELALWAARALAVVERGKVVPPVQRNRPACRAGNAGRDVQVLLAALLAVLVLGCSARIAPAQEPGGGALPPKPGADGFIRLFNGRNLEGWKGLSDYWSVIAGSIRGHQEKARSKQTFLVFTGLNVKDFELRLRYRFASPTGNSGIQFRSRVLDPAAFRVGGYQADLDAALQYAGTVYDEAGVAGDRGTMSNRGEATVWDSDNARHSTPLKERAADLKRAIKRGGWNDVDLLVKGPHIIYTINGHVMTDLTDDSPAALKEGVLALQLHQGFTMDVRFKDLRLQLLAE